MKQRETTFTEKLDFATKLRKTDARSGILDFLPSSKDFDDNENSAQQPENNISHLYVLSQESQEYPQAIEYGIKDEDGAKVYYSKVSEKQHRSFEFEEPGRIISRHHSWI
ncbi:hypothetical protein P5673_020905 [Acropora cervicornis]|uniref:Uncharacterized protein n=1 Tax=Acropora cervicornis TaxID=6130 RepID=A0AAD9Q9A0_ACRCE|nr:hypothetical protein P5673_020905 [Acropora cervicornis]